MLLPYHDCHGFVLLGLQLSEEIFGFQTRQQFLCLPKKAGRNKYLMERHQIKTLGYMLGYTLDIGWYWIDIDWDIGMSQVGNSWSCLKMPKWSKMYFNVAPIFGSATSRSNSGPPRSGGKGAVFASFCRAAWQWCLYNVVGELQSCKHIRVVYCAYGIVK